MLAPMRRAALIASATVGLLVATEQGATASVVQPTVRESGALRLLDVTPARLDGPGSVTVRVRVTGRSDATTSTSLELHPNVSSAPATGASVRVTSVAVEAPASLQATSFSAAALAIVCRRGEAVPAGGTTYALTIPAATAPVLTVTLDVPRGVRGTQAGIQLRFGDLAAPGEPVPAIQRVMPVALKRSGLRPSVELKQRAVAGGRVRLSGKVRGVKTGTRVEFVGTSVPAGAGASGADSALGTDTQAFAPLGDGLRRLGTARTKRGGSFAATLAIPANTAVLARTGGALPGASCPLLVAE